MPAPLSEIVMRCLAKAPAERFARGIELADALIAFLRTSTDDAASYRAAVVARRGIRDTGGDAENGENGNLHGGG